MKKRFALPLVWIFSSAVAVLLLRLLDYIQLMPPAATEQARIVDHTFHAILVLTVVIFCLVLGTLIYSILKFKTDNNQEEGTGFHHSRGWKVEGLWIVSTTILTFWLAGFGIQELRQLMGAPVADLDIQVTASQFSWEFFYPKYNQLGSRLVLPLNKRIRLDITSKDVVHSFWVPEFRTKQDALPGRVSTLYLTPDRPGTYLLMCNELCGLDHTVMTAYVDVVNEEDFEKRITGGAESW